MPDTTAPANNTDLSRRRFGVRISEIMQEEQPDAFSALSVCAFIIAAYIAESKSPLGLEQEFQRMLRRALEVTYEKKLGVETPMTPTNKEENK